MGTEKMRLLGRYRGALAVGYALVDRQGRSFTFQCNLRGTRTVQAPGIEQLQIPAALWFRADIRGVRKAGKRVFGRKSGDVIGCAHGLPDGGIGEIRSAGVAPALAAVHGDAQTLVAVALDVFQSAVAHRHAQTAGLRHLGCGIGGAKFVGGLQGGIHAGLKKCTAVGKALQRLRVAGCTLAKGGGGGGCGSAGCNGGRCGGAWGVLHSEGYDTCPCPENPKKATT